jgi:hypothetical protein
MYYCFFFLYMAIVAVQECISFASHGTMHMLFAVMSVFGLARATGPSWVDLLTYFGHSFCFGMLFYSLFVR